MGVSGGEEKPKFARLIIPTLDSVRLDRLLDLVTSVNEKALFVGGPGTAKTTVMKQFMARSDDEGAPAFTQKAITFSSLTTPQTFQLSVEASVEKRSGKTYGPPGQKKMIVFVDDISMPLMNDWGDQVTNEVVRQLLEQGGMYSLEKPIGDMKMIIDCQYLAAMNTPAVVKRHPQPSQAPLLHLQRPAPLRRRHQQHLRTARRRSFLRRRVLPRGVRRARSLCPSPSTCGIRCRRRCSHARQVSLPVQHARTLEGVPGRRLGGRDRFKILEDESQRKPYGGNLSLPRVPRGRLAS